MKLILFPQRRDDELSLSLQGEILTISGDMLDLSSVPEGATVPMEAIDSPFIIAPIERINGELHVSLLLPQSTPFGVFDEIGNKRPPYNLTVDRDGDIALPVEPVAPQEEQFDAD